MNENHLIDFFEENVASMESRGSLASQAYSQLLYWIVSLKFRPGEHLQERFLGEQLKMSRTPIREALKRLDQENWVKLTCNGIIVKKVDATVIQDVCEVREILEVRGVDHIIANDDAHSAFVNMALIHEVMTNRRVNDFKFILTNQRFHAYLSTVRPNRVLHDLWKRNSLEHFRLGQLALATAEDRKSRATDEHKDIIDALIARDGERARHSLIKHLRIIRDRLLTSLA